VYYTEGVYLLGKFQKLQTAILSGQQDVCIRFSDVCMLLAEFGFTERIKGDHHIFTMPGIEEIVNIQPVGSKAKPYQVKQIRNLILRYKLGGNV